MDATPRNIQSKIIKDAAFLNTATLVNQGLQFIKSLFIFRFLDPYAYGLWMGLQVLLNYSTYAGLGIEQGMLYRIPYHQARGDEERVEEIVFTSFVVWSGLTLLFAAGVLLYGLFMPAVEGVVRLGLVIMAAIIMVEQQINYFTRWQTTYRKDFVIMGVSRALRGILLFGIAVPLAYFFNVSGLMAAVLAVTLVILIYVRVKTPIKIRIAVSKPVLIELYQFGFPILVIALLRLVLETVDRIMILRFLGVESLGFYGITAYASSTFYPFVAIAGSTFLPHIIDALGRSQDHAPALEKYLLKPTLMFSYISAWGIMAVSAVIPLFVRFWSPKYIPGIPAFYAFIPGIFFLSIIILANNTLVTVLGTQNRQRVAVAVQAISVAIKAGLTIMFISLGWDLFGVGLASTLAYAIYGVTILWMAARQVMPERGSRIRFILNTLVPGMYCLAATPLIIWLASGLFVNQVILRMLTLLVLTVFAGLPMLWALNRQVDFKSELGPLVTEFKQKVLSRIGH